MSTTQDSKPAAIKYNPGEDIFVHLFSNQHMVLISEDTKEVQVEFEKQVNDITSVCWVDNVSGDFVTSTSKVGALRLWNAAHSKPKDMIKVGP